MRLTEVFARPGPVFSYEFFPPKTEEGLGKLFSTIEHLGELSPSFVSITYGAGGSTRGKTVQIASHIKSKLGLEPVAHLTCTDQTSEEIGETLSRLHGEGVENVLALRGDPAKGQGAFVAREDGFGHANELVSFVRERGQFCIGAACYPEGHIENPDKEDDLERLVNKVNAGSDFLITQLFFDNRMYFEFVRRARAAGIGVPILPGLMPVTNVRQLEKFTSMCGATVPAALAEKLGKVSEDEQAVMAIGIEWCMRQARELLALGAPGIHFYTLNKSLATRVVHAGLQGWSGAAVAV
jgi:methylenetetrahydrofolate reductase (NADH)